MHLSQQAEAPVTVGLRQGLRDLGYVEGRDVVLEIQAGALPRSILVQATGVIE